MTALKPFGPSFAREIETAGLIGPWSFESDGRIFGRENLSPEQDTALQAVIDAHDASAVPIDDYRRAIQARVDATAQARQYDSGITCASYVGSTNPGWAAEAQAFAAWRDAVWGYAYAELAKVKSGQREQPTIETILAELPTLTWP